MSRGPSSLLLFTLFSLLPSAGSFGQQLDSGYIDSKVPIGNGVWKSTDGGETWEHMGLEKSGRISRIVVHPDNPAVQKW